MALETPEDANPEIDESDTLLHQNELKFYRRNMFDNFVPKIELTVQKVVSERTFTSSNGEDMMLLLNSSGQLGCLNVDC
jgi:hypothetical protein